MSRHKTGEQKDGIAKRGSSYSYIVRVKDPDISTTLRIYAHIRPEQKQEVADLFARAIENG